VDGHITRGGGPRRCRPSSRHPHHAHRRVRIVAAPPDGGVLDANRPIVVQHTGNLYGQGRLVRNTLACRDSHQHRHISTDRDLVVPLFQRHLDGIARFHERRLSKAHQQPDRDLELGRVSSQRTGEHTKPRLYGANRTIRVLHQHPPVIHRDVHNSIGNGPTIKADRLEGVPSERHRSGGPVVGSFEHRH